MWRKVSSRRSAAFVGFTVLIWGGWPLAWVSAGAEQIRFVSWSSPRVEQANFFVAQEKGYFKEEGVEFEYRPGRGSGDALKHVLAGNGDLAFVGPEAVFLAAQRGGPVIAFYNTYPQNIFELVYHGDLGIHSVKDLRGKKIGVFSLASGGRYNLTTLLYLNGVKEAEVTLIPTLASPAPFLERKIDGWMSISPTTWAMREKGLLKGTSSFRVQDHLNLPTDVFATTGEILGKRKGALLSFLRAFNRGTRFMIENPEEATRVSMKYAVDVKDPRLAEGIVRLFGEASQSAQTRKKGLGWFETEILEKAERLFRETGILKEKVDVKIHFTNDLVERL